MQKRSLRKILFRFESTSFEPLTSAILTNKAMKPQLEGKVILSGNIIPLKLTNLKWTALLVVASKLSSTAMVSQKSLV